MKSHHVGLATSIMTGAAFVAWEVATDGNVREATFGALLGVVLGQALIAISEAGADWLAVRRKKRIDGERI